jgi:hypothetical protein
MNQIRKRNMHNAAVAAFIREKRQLVGLPFLPVFPPLAAVIGVDQVTFAGAVLPVSLQYDLE